MTPLEEAKSRLIELGVRHDASRPAAVHPVWRAGAMAGMGLLTGVMLAARGRSSRGTGGRGIASKVVMAATPWLASVLLRR